MIKMTPEGIWLPVKVAPKSGKNRVVGWENAELKICIAAVPKKGEVNEELIRFLAKELKIARSKIKIARGHLSQHKMLVIDELSLAQSQLDVLYLPTE